MELIQNLTLHHNTTRKEATEIINKEFPELANAQKPEKTKISQKEIENINEKTRQLIETLKFYSPKNRRKYLDNSDNFDKFILTGSKPAATREISFTQTGTTLRLDFRIPLPGARVDGSSALSGNYTFNLVKK